MSEKFFDNTRIFKWAARELLDQAKKRGGQITINKNLLLIGYPIGILLAIAFFCFAFFHWDLDRDIIAGFGVTIGLSIPLAFICGWLRGLCMAPFLGLGAYVGAFSKGDYIYFFMCLTVSFLFGYFFASFVPKFVIAIFLDRVRWLRITIQLWQKERKRAHLRVVGSDDQHDDNT